MVGNEKNLHKIRDSVNATIDINLDNDKWFPLG